MFLPPACSQEALQTGEAKLFNMFPSENSLPSHHLSQQHFLTFSLPLGSSYASSKFALWHSPNGTAVFSSVGTPAFVEYQKVSSLPDFSCSV